MRLIDADKLIENITNTADLGGWIGDTLRQIKRLAVRYIDSAPSIDIVRCSECVYSNGVGEYCQNDHFVEEDTFCSYGEREGE